MARRDTIALEMREQQFTLHRSTGKHRIWKHSSGALVTTPKTPSDHRCLLNVRQTVRRALAATAA